MPDIVHTYHSSSSVERESPILLHDVLHLSSAIRRSLTGSTFAANRTHRVGRGTQWWTPVENTNAVRVKKSMSLLYLDCTSDQLCPISVSLLHPKLILTLWPTLSLLLARTSSFQRIDLLLRYLSVEPTEAVAEDKPSP